MALRPQAEAPPHVGRDDTGRDRYARRMAVVVLGLMLAIAFAGIGGFLGLAAGAFFGGNYASQFEAFGMRGYEACGVLGGLLGVALGGAGGGWMGVRLGQRMRRRHRT